MDTGPSLDTGGHPCRKRDSLTLNPAPPPPLASTPPAGEGPSDDLCGGLHPAIHHGLTGRGPRGGQAQVGGWHGVGRGGTARSPQVLRVKGLRVKGLRGCPVAVAVFLGPRLPSCGAQTHTTEVGIPSCFPHNTSPQSPPLTLWAPHTPHTHTCVSTHPLGLPRPPPPAEHPTHPAVSPPPRAVA